MYRLLNSRYWAATFFAGAMVALAATVAFPVRGEQPNQVREFMRPKLQHSQKLLEGLALEDFDLIAKEAQELSLLSQAANWQVLQTEDYLHHSEQFRRAANKVRDAANDKNLDRATLGYFELTAQCVYCHKHLRAVRMANTTGKQGS